MAVRERENAGKELQRRQGVVIEQANQSAHKQRVKGKLSARRRVDLLLDPGSFVELDALSRSGDSTGGQGQEHYGDGVITGYGAVDGRPVCVFSQDATFMGGSLGEVHARRILKVMDLALRTGRPIIGINDGAGARIQEGVVSQALYAEIFHRNVKASGVIPQISLIMGYCAGGAAYSPALTDFVVMVDQASHMFITGPDVVKAVTGEEIGVEELGGARTHSSVSGNAHYLAADEEEAIDYVKDLLSFLPDNNVSFPPEYPADALTDDSVESDAERRPGLDDIVPTSSTQPYDMRDVIEQVVDDIGLVEIQGSYAPNIVIGFSRVEGASVGIVASQPLHLAGCLDINASEKAARFVRTCNAFNIPVLTFVDVPGFLPGTDQEWTGIIRRGAKLIYAYAEATVPLVTVITRKAYGAGYDVLGSKHLGADVNLAWPGAEIAVMGAEGATDIVHRRKLASVRAEGGDVDAVREELRREYEDRLCNPYVAAERGYIDAVIQPSTTRSHVARALRMLRSKRDLTRTERGNMPL
ncbi:acyl-CoA carboxylase subunit beta [Streptomyces sp. 130]|uniref:acyl-CoA carboxylase subunit beta n=1 Tax=Streptomyces sp. 130 TaxID=2591006 RepID=UPI00117D30B5|nr:acyl-CoA carboxylase subunit beta [Streptomyces sp. 130]TRV72007.1 acyl-CoA carboxylase subunit beta [Streptomyces sp. 130]